MTNDLNSAFKRQLNSKSKNKIVRLLSVILLVIIIMFSIFLLEGKVELHLKKS